MHKFLAWLGWFFVFVAVGILGSTLLAEVSVVDHLKNAMPAGVLLALAGQLLTQSRSLSEANEKRSLFKLESALKAFEQARLLLVEGNSDRSNWVEAGRVLGHAKILASEVSVDAHKRVLELKKLEYRRFFYELLASKPAPFFYGVSQIPLSLDEAARKSTAPEDLDGRRITSTRHELAEPSIYAIWEAAQWPDNYLDPLNKKFTDSEICSLQAKFPGLHQFLEHKKQWRSVSGVLHPRVEK